MMTMRASTIILSLFSLAFLGNYCCHTQSTCTRTRARTSYYSKSGSRVYYYSQSYSTCCNWICWSRCRKSRTRSAYERYYYQANRITYSTEYYCCSGYSGNYPSCQPICSGGCGHGTCVAPATCSCQAGWTGSKCTNDINECSYEKGGCEHNCHNTAGSYYCSCKNGYKLLLNKHSCEDINECSTGNGGCDHKCHNNIGSYSCSCNIGYKLQSDGHSCRDIDECTVSNGECDHKCHNTAGSFYCTCNSGYVLLSDGTDCKDHDECTNTTNHGCDHQCHNTEGGYYCTCNVGYELHGTKNCIDTNECNTNNGNCDQICTNKEGSYQCSCKNGYELSKNSHACNDINECSSDNGGCGHVCTNSIGSYSCSCRSGYHLDNNQQGCQDTNECTVSNGGCNHTCHNTNGSYYCSCNTGYILLEDGKGCTDHDECINNNHGCEHQCHNTEGGYYCTCSDGYKLHGTKTCLDINECTTNIATCSDICSNLPGSFRCTCYKGYQLSNADNATCNDINECDTSNGGCDQICINKPGKYECRCRSGYSLSVDEHSCNDINECSSENGGCQQSCVNTVGGYKCSCRQGYRLNSTDLHSCYDIDECNEGVVSIGGGGLSEFWCSQKCVNIPGWYGCDCNTGYILGMDNKTCLDTNECIVSNGGCNHTCHNTNGSYYCSCNTGYVLLENRHNCTDHDECSNNVHNCDHDCHNTIGGYHCSCYDGYNLVDDNICIDIDECQDGISGCSQNCLNSVGSFECSCYSGFLLSATDNKTCNDIDECEFSNGGCSQICTNQQGSYQCSCNIGYGLLKIDNHTCFDINECISGNGGCEHICFNNNGSYSCSCSEGYMLENGHFCKDIDECNEDLVIIGGDQPSPEMQGFWCQQQCINTLGSFRCSCMQGFVLDKNNQTCTDIDECLTSNGGCDHNCHNTIGSYHCTCDDGYLILEDKKGCKDHDECTNEVHNCDHTCHNTKGGYRCSCFEGYTLYDTKHCEDIDECLDDLSNCTDICDNLLGSFSCDCFDGYYLSSDDNATCLDIDECTLGLDNCSQLCVNEDGSFFCDCFDGYTLDEDSTTCLGEPCAVNLNAPINGHRSCTGPQVTNETCTFTCDPGYSLSSDLNTRICQANHTWSGNDIECIPMECSPLQPHMNALIVEPCVNKYNFSCTAVCKHGYHVPNSTNQYKWIQSCIINSTKDGVEWTEARKCVEKNPCEDNPCNAGVCSVLDGNIQCDCEGLFRFGERCDTTYFDVSPIQIMDMNTPADIMLTSAVPFNVNVTIVISNSSGLKVITPSSNVLEFYPNYTPESAKYTLIANSPGLYDLSYIVSPSNDIATPLNSVVYVRAGTKSNQETYFDILNVEEGIITPGCCKYGPIKVNQCLSELTFYSSCEWTNIIDENMWKSNGIVFVGNNYSLNLPLSIKGVKVSGIDGSIIQNENPSSYECATSCGSDLMAHQTCHPHVAPASLNIELFVKSQSIVKTFFKQIKLFTPDWLTAAILPDSGHYAYDYQASILNGSSINEIPECRNMITLANSNDLLYYVIRTKATFHLELDSLNAFVHSEALPHCIIVDMSCGHIKPQLYYMIPDSLQPSRLTSLQYIRNILTGNGELSFERIVLSRNGITLKRAYTNDKYWNGTANAYKPPVTQFDFEIQSRLRKTFIAENSLFVNCEFNGNMLYSTTYNDIQMVPGVLDGKLFLNICMQVGDEIGCITLLPANKISLFTLPEFTQPQTLLSGIAFKLNYKFNTSSALSKIVHPQSSKKACLVDGFMRVDSHLNLDSVILTAECIALRLQSAVFPNAFKHIVFFNGNLNGYHTDRLIVRSILNQQQVMLGNFIEIKRMEKEAMEYHFNGSDLSSITGFIRNVNVSVFDSAVFFEKLLLRNDQFFVFNATTVIFSSFPISFEGRISVKENFNVLKIDGGLLYSSNFRNRLSTSLNIQLKREIELVTKRRQNIEIMYKNTNDLLKNISFEYENALQEYQTLLVELKSTNESYHSLSRWLEESFTNESDNSCLGEVCLRDECHNNSICSICDSTEKVDKTGVCEVFSSTKKLVTRYKQSKYTVWRYETKCSQCWEIVWYLLPYYSTHNCCLSELVPYVEYQIVPYQVLEEFEEMQYTNCKTDEVNFITQALCCKEYNCSFRFHNFSCLKSNIACLNEMQSSEYYSEYYWARVNLTALEIEYTTVESKLYVMKQLIDFYRYLQEVVLDTIDKQGKAVEKIGNITSASVAGLNPEVEIKILSARFALLMSDSSPITFPVEFLVEFNGTEMKIIVDINFLNSVELIYHQISVRILDSILGEIQQTRKKREVIHTDAANKFMAICAELANIESFCLQLLDSIDNFTHQFQVNSEKINDLHLKFNLPYDDENYYINSYNTLELEVNFVIDQLKKVTETYSVSFWQHTFDDFLNNGSNINGYNCINVVDCLVMAVYDLDTTLNDMPMSEADMIIEKITLIKENVRSVEAGNDLIHILTTVKDVLIILDEVEHLNYWCSKPPTIVKQPPAQINVVSGETLELSVEVQSSLPVEYYWMHNSKLIDYKASTMRIQNIQLIEGGQYSCTVISDAGKVSSLTTEVIVLLAPVLNVTLNPVYETYMGDENQFHLLCDGYGIPSPRWRWLYKATLNDDWKQINNVNSNVLSFSRVEYSDEGYYTCSAFNEVEVINSSFTFLRVLPTEAVAVEYQINFELKLFTLQSYTNLEIVKMITNSIRNNFQFDTTQLSKINAAIYISPYIYQIDFSIHTPYDKFYSTLSVQDIVKMMEHYVAELEESRMNLFTIFPGIALNNQGIKASIVPNSFSIGPRTFICPNGYQIHQSQILCVGCSLGEYNGGQKSQFTTDFSGNVIEHVLPICIGCGIGHYQENVSQTKCNNCPYHYSTFSTGSVSVDQCYSLCEPHTTSIDGFQPCISCPHHYYQPNYGSTECIHCSNATYFVEICHYSESLLSSSTLAQLEMTVSTFSPEVSPVKKKSTSLPQEMLLTIITFGVTIPIIIGLIIIISISITISKRKQKALSESSHLNRQNTIELTNFYEESSSSEKNKSLENDENLKKSLGSQLDINDEPIYDDLIFDAN